MSDLIKREDAIKAIKYPMLDALNTEERISLIMSIPSVDTTECICCEYRVGNECCYSDVDIKADRPAKKWIKQSGDEWVVRVECPNCHRRFQFSPRLMWKRCPLCEIKMNGMVKRKGDANVTLDRR